MRGKTFSSRPIGYVSLWKCFSVGIVIPKLLLVASASSLEGFPWAMDSKSMSSSERPESRTSSPFWECEQMYIITGRVFFKLFFEHKLNENVTSRTEPFR